MRALNATIIIIELNNRFCCCDRIIARWSQRNCTRWVGGQAFACFAFRYFFPARLIESEPHIAVHHPPRTPGPLRTQPSDTIEKGGVPPFQQATNQRRARRGVAFATILVLFRPVALRISLSSQRKVSNSFREREIWGGSPQTEQEGRTITRHRRERKSI